MEGRNSPPTNYHIWIKSDNTINLFTNEQWQSLIDPNVKLELTNYINQQISNLKDGVSIDFDTLKEISDWINKHELDYVKILDQLETTVSVTGKQAVKWSNVPGSTAVSFTGDNNSSTWNTLTSVPVTFAVNEYTTSSTEREMCRIWIYRHGQSFHQLAILYLTNQNPEQTIYLPINLARMNNSYNEVLEFNIEPSTYYTPYDYVKLTTKNGLDVASGPYVSFAYPTQYLNQTFNNYTDCIQQLYRVDIYKNAFTI